VNGGPEIADEPEKFDSNLRENPVKKQSKSGNLSSHPTSPRPAPVKQASRLQPEGRAAREDRILFVDDERNVLDGYRRLLHDEFEIETAQGGGQALAAIHRYGPYAIVISDVRMPGMNGAEFLTQVRQVAPNTVRMLLTGYRDIDQAIEAVNEGRIFRYLNKPCQKDELIAAINLGLAQYHANVENEDTIKHANEFKLQADSLSKVLLSHHLR
jgi:DNA-binding NtrC family response regulator